MPRVTFLVLIFFACFPAGALAAVYTGTLNLRHSDDFKASRSTAFYTLKTPMQELRVKFSGKLKVKAGSKVRLSAKYRQGVLVARARDLKVISPPRRAKLLAQKKVGVILLNFTNDRSQPWTTAQVRDIVFSGADSVNSYYLETSFGDLGLSGRDSPSGDIYGYYEINDDNLGCDYSGWANQAYLMATGSGADLSGYDSLVYVWPYTGSCGWAGLAYLPGSTSWINGYLDVQTVGHELGHNFGVHHASSYRCLESGTRVAISPAANCSANEYGDPFDIMGYHGDRQMNSFHKAQLGFLGSRTQEASSNGIYTLSPQNITSASTQQLKIPRAYVNGSPTEYYYLEYRRPSGLYDDFNLADAVVNGVSIRIGPNLNSMTQSKLIDATPVTDTFFDSALPVGSTFTDSEAGIEIETLSASNLSAQVEITFPSDLQPPVKPTGLNLSVNAGKISLGWSATTDNTGVAGYKIYRGGTLIGTTTSTTYEDSGLNQNQTYSYQVSAYDAAANESSKSSTVSILFPDFTAPTKPEALTGTLLGSSIYLDWQSSSDNVAVTSYRVYRDGQLVGTSYLTNYTEYGLVEGMAYSFQVKARDGTGNLSEAASFSFQVPDTTPPGKVEGFSVLSLSPSLVLGWKLVPGASHYLIFKDGQYLGKSLNNAYQTQPMGGVYQVKAVDAAGNLGQVSEIKVSLDPSPENPIKPEEPKNDSAPRNHREIGLNLKPGFKLKWKKELKVTIGFEEIKRVELWLDGKRKLKSQKLKLKLKLDPKKLKSGDHQLVVKVYLPGNELKSEKLKFRT